MDVVTLCECNHLSIDHVRWLHGDYPCSQCTCTDLAVVIPDDQTARDITMLLGA